VLFAIGRTPGGSRSGRKMLLDKEQKIAAAAPGIYRSREARYVLSRNELRPMPTYVLLSNLTDEGAKIAPRPATQAAAGM